jgi:hypothetical protein
MVHAQRAICLHIARATDKFNFSREAGRPIRTDGRLRSVYATSFIALRTAAVNPLFY